MYADRHRDKWERETIQEDFSKPSVLWNWNNDLLTKTKHDYLFTVMGHLSQLESFSSVTLFCNWLKIIITSPSWAHHGQFTCTPGWSWWCHHIPPAACPLTSGQRTVRIMGVFLTSQVPSTQSSPSCWVRGSRRGRQMPPPSPGLLTTWQTDCRLCCWSIRGFEKKMVHQLLGFTENTSHPFLVKQWSTFITDWSSSAVARTAPGGPSCQLLSISLCNQSPLHQDQEVEPHASSCRRKTNTNTLTLDSYTFQLSDP